MGGAEAKPAECGAYPGETPNLHHREQGRLVESEVLSGDGMDAASNGNTGESAKLIHQ